MPSSIWGDYPGKEVIVSSPAFPRRSALYFNACTVNSKDLFQPQRPIQLYVPWAGPVMTLRRIVVLIGYYMDPNENRFSPVDINSAPLVPFDSS